MTAWLVHLRDQLVPNFSDLDLAVGTIQRRRTEAQEKLQAA